MRGLRLILVAAIAVVGLFVAGDPASAAITTNTSALGAGYKSEPPGGVTSASVKLQVPDITCAANDPFEGLLLGVFALNGSNVRTLSAFVQASCVNGSLLYFASVDNGSTHDEISVAIGDTVTARLTEDGVTSTVTVKNITDHNNSASLAKSAAKDPRVLVGDLGSQVVPTFTKVRMLNAMVNGTVIGDAPATTRERLKSGSNIQVTASLVAAGKGGFTLGFRANQ